jgi:hypothetical protein
MPTAEQLLKEKISILEKSPEKFNTSVEKEQLKLLKEALKLTEKLELDGNKIKVSLKNISLIEEINKKLEISLTKGEYFSAVKELLTNMDQAAKLTNEFMQKTIDGFERSKLADEVYKLQRTKAAELLIGQSSIDANFLQPVKNTILDAVTQETTLQQLVKNLNETIIGTPQYEGKLQRYTKQIASDALSVTDRVYTTTISNEIGVEFYQYLGGELDTTRCFCEVRNGKYFHKKEIEAWGSGDITEGFEGTSDLSAAKECGKDWQGKYRGTNSSNIFNWLGGYNCKHSLAPKSLISVPKTVLNRAIEKGYFKPSEKQKKLLNL